MSWNIRCGSMSRVKRAVKALSLDESQLEHCEVNIIDVRRCYAPVPQPIDSSDPHIAVYKKFRTSIVDMIYQRLGDSWNTLGLYEVRFNPSHRQSTLDVVIFVQRLCCYDWSSLVLAIQDRISRIEPAYMGVQFLPSELSFGPHEQNRPGKSLAGYATKFPYLRASIGLAGEEGGGTWGA